MKLHFLAAAMVAATLGAAALGADPVAPAGGGQAAMQGETSSVSGTVQSFNYGPRGIDGMMISADGKVTQINVGPELGAQISQSVAVGDQIKATARPDNGPPGGPGGRRAGRGPGGGPRGGGGGGGGGDQGGGGGPGAGPEAGPGGGPEGGPMGGPPRPEMKPDHPVMRAVSVTDAKGKEYKMPSPEDRKAIHVEGSVKAMNYDARGSANGVQLDSGEVVLMSPQDAKVLDLSAGKKVTADGVGEKLPSGVTMIEGNTVNGITVHAGGPGGPRGQGGGGQRGPRGGGQGGPGGPGGGENGPPPGQ